MRAGRGRPEIKSPLYPRKRTSIGKGLHSSVCFVPIADTVLAQTSQIPYLGNENILILCAFC